MQAVGAIDVIDYGPFIYKLVDLPNARGSNDLDTTLRQQQMAENLIYGIALGQSVTLNLSRIVSLCCGIVHLKVSGFSFKFIEKSKRIFQRFIIFKEF